MLSGGMGGRLALEVALSGGVVQAARLRAGRTVTLCRAMVGRPARDVPAAFERLFAVCGRSHRVAVRLALDAARGRTPTASFLQASLRDLAAERVGEHLRSTYTTAVAVGLPAEPAEQAALRAAFAATRPGASGTQIDAALAVLGLHDAAPPPASWAARMLDAAGPAADGAGPADALTAADDAAVLAALARLGTAYAARPHLPLRRPETGALARIGGTAAPRDRLVARFAEIRAAAALLREAARPAPSAWIASGTMPDGRGYAAVETPRGRMHHLVGVDAADRVTLCDVLAPTEWNFHPEGPLVQALPGLRVGRGAAAEARLRWLIGLFDPCVACTLEVLEEAHA